MNTIPASIATAVFSALLLAAALPAQTTDAAAPPTSAAAQSRSEPSGEVSKVRIVRLSEVKGVVQLVVFQILALEPFRMDWLHR